MKINEKCKINMDNWPEEKLAEQNQVESDILENSRAIFDHAQKDSGIHIELIILKFWGHFRT